MLGQISLELTAGRLLMVEDLLGGGLADIDDGQTLVVPGLHLIRPPAASAPQPLAPSRAGRTLPVGESDVLITALLPRDDAAHLAFQHLAEHTQQPSPGGRQVGPQRRVGRYTGRGGTRAGNRLDMARPLFLQVCRGQPIA